MLVFVKERAAAVDAQLAGKSEGQVLGRPRPGDRRPPEFKPEELLEPALMTALDVNQDRTLDREELVGGFARWFATWAGDDAGALLAVDRLRDGLNTAVPLRPGGPRPR